MKYQTTDIELAYELDSLDELARFRQEFVINDENLLYLDGNSLGRLPKTTRRLLQETVEDQWGERLIRGWNEGWMDTTTSLGARIAKLIGARTDEVLVCDSTSVNLFKLAAAAIKFMPDRNTILSDELNFPSDLYILQGVAELLGNRHTIRLLPTTDGIHTHTENIAADDPHLPAFWEMGYFEVFRRVEMYRDIE